MPMKFSRNLSNLDRLVRFCLGIALIYLGLFSGYIENNVLVVLVSIFGVINIFSAIINHCPVYNLANISTYRDKPKGA